MSAEDPIEQKPPSEPLWLVRFVFILVLVGFAAFLAREGRNFLHSLP